MKKLIDKVKKGDRKAEQELYKICCAEIDLTLRKYVDCEPTKKDIKVTLMSCSLIFQEA